MKTIDLTKLIEGLLAVIFIAVAIGRFNDLQAFARREATRSLHGWDNHVFFPGEHKNLMGGVVTGSGKSHLKGAAFSSSPFIDRR